MNNTSDTRGCIKCNHSEVETKGLAITGDDFDRILNIQSNQFTAISCKKCGYTEFYKTDDNENMDLLDLFFNL